MKVFKRWRKNRSPRTLVGQWLRAGVLRQDSVLRANYRERLDHVQWRDAAPVVSAAFELAVHHAFDPRNVASDISTIVAGMRKSFATDGVDPIPQAEGEILMRAALGEDVSVEEVPEDVAFVTRALVFVGIAWDLYYSKPELDATLVKAEKIAIDKGYSPTLA